MHGITCPWRSFASDEAHRLSPPPVPFLFGPITGPSLRQDGTVADDYIRAATMGWDDCYFLAGKGVVLRGCTFTRNRGKNKGLYTQYGHLGKAGRRVPRPKETSPHNLFFVFLRAQVSLTGTGVGRAREKVIGQQ